jgi:hypothetical protein
MKMWIFIYLYGISVTFFTSVWNQKESKRDEIEKLRTALFAAILWPIVIPAKLLFKLLY